MGDTRNSAVYPTPSLQWIDQEHSVSAGGHTLGTELAVQLVGELDGAGASCSRYTFLRIMRSMAGGGGMGGEGSVSIQVWELIKVKSKDKNKKETGLG